MGTAEEVAVTFRLGQENDRDFPIFETELSHYKRIEKLALSAGKRLRPVPLYPSPQSPPNRKLPRPYPAGGAFFGCHTPKAAGSAAH